MSEKYKNEDSRQIINALNLIGGKWKIPILWTLCNSALRYNELKRRLNGITNIMLTRCLRELEEAGLVERIQYSDIPPHVEYSLTEHSRKLGPVLVDMGIWADTCPNSTIKSNETNSLIQAE